MASYINLEKAKAQGIRVCNVVHYGDHAVAEHTMALLMELTRHVGQLDREVKAGDWAGNDGYELARSSASSASAASARLWPVSQTPTA